MWVSSLHPRIAIGTKPLSFQPEEPTPSIPSRIRTGVLEIAEVCPLLRHLTYTYQLGLAVRQIVSRDACTLPIRWGLRQESLGTSRGRKAAWHCI